MAILFDDMTRPTRVYELIPYVLEQLYQGGIEKRNIRFICALGTHGALKRDDFVKKLGQSTLINFRFITTIPMKTAPSWAPPVTAAQCRSIPNSCTVT